MKTTCPTCHTVFRITPEHIKARAGIVRCGECQSIFNALDTLVDEKKSVVENISPTVAPKVVKKEVLPKDKVPEQTKPAPVNVPLKKPEQTGIEKKDTVAARVRVQPEIREILTEDKAAQETGTDKVAVSDEGLQSAPVENVPQMAQKPLLSSSPAEAILISDEKKWSERSLWTYDDKPPMSRGARNIYLGLIVLLVFLSFTQMAFYWRTDIVAARPGWRHFFENWSTLVGSKLEFPRQAELVSIETSGLHNDSNDNRLLVLKATLRNQANYFQEFPAIELSLTDTYEAVLARRVLLPDDYLPEGVKTDDLLAPRADVPIQLWMDTVGLEAAGYRLYVFYP